ncbi:hypothetical protein Tco_1268783, partial [Tanacetum coccineum]
HPNGSAACKFGGVKGNDEGRYVKTSELNSNTSVRNPMKSERWNQGLSPTGKLLQASGSGPLGPADNEKELWDSRMHQTGKEVGGEGMPKVSGLRRLKQGKPFIPSSLHIPTRLVPIHVNPYSQSSANLAHGQALNFPLQTQTGNPPAGGTFAYHPQGGYIPQAFTNNGVPSYYGHIHPTVAPSSSYPFYAQTMCAPPNMSVYPNPTGSFADSACSVTPFVRWIEDYPLPDGLKMPSHIGSYDGKGDPDNLLYLFEGAIRMQKWLMPIACHMFTYTLKDFARIWWNSQKAGSILNYEDLKAKFRSHFNDTLQILGLHEEQRISGFVHGLRTRSLVEHISTDLPSTYKGLMEKAYTWVEAREVATNGVLNNQRDDSEISKKFSWGNNIRQKDRGRLSPYKGQNHKLLSNLVKSPREILTTEKVAKTFEQPPRLPRANWSKDKTRYCHFHEDYRHETNQCRELRHQIEEAVKSGQLSHLVKGVKKRKGLLILATTTQLLIGSISLIAKERDTHQQLTLPDLLTSSPSTSLILILSHMSFVDDLLNEVEPGNVPNTEETNTEQHDMIDDDDIPMAPILRNKNNQIKITGRNRLCRLSDEDESEEDEDIEDDEWV